MSDNFLCVTRISTTCKSSGIALVLVNHVLHAFGYSAVVELGFADSLFEWVCAKAGERNEPRDRIIQMLRLLSGVGAPMSTTNLAPDQVEVITYDDLSFKIVRAGDEYTVSADFGATASLGPKVLLLEVWRKAGVNFTHEVFGEEKPT